MFLKLNKCICIHPHRSHHAYGNSDHQYTHADGIKTNTPLNFSHNFYPLSSHENTTKKRLWRVLIIPSWKRYLNDCCSDQNPVKPMDLKDWEPSRIRWTPGEEPACIGENQQKNRLHAGGRHQWIKLNANQESKQGVMQYQAHNHR